MEVKLHFIRKVGLIPYKNVRVELGGTPEEVEKLVIVIRKKILSQEHWEEL